jgi:hypothetical protein
MASKRERGSRFAHVALSNLTNSPTAVVDDITVPVKGGRFEARFTDVV